MDHDQLADRLTGAAPEQASQLEELLLKKLALLHQQSRTAIDTLFRDNATEPVRIASAQVTNGQAFRDSFLHAQLLPLLQRNPTTLQGLSAAIDAVSRNFSNAGAAKSVAVSLTTPATLPFMRPRTRPGLEVVPVLHIEPVSRYFAKTGTNIGNGEGDTYVQFQFRNIFGGGENLVLDAVKGTRTPSLYLLNYNQPVWNNANYMAETLAYVNTRTMDWIGAGATTRGLTAKLYTQFARSNHELVLENCWRSLTNHNSRSLEVLSQLGDDFKSSLIYNWKYDTRNNVHLPTCGHYLRLGVEYSGLFAANNVRYAKVVAETQHAAQITRSHSAIATVRGGIIQGRGMATSILDRFFMGGPNDVRSFVHNGLGPKQFASCVGGDVFASGGVSVVSRLPGKAHDSNFRLHTFANGGTLVLGPGGGWVPSVGCGFGVLYNHPMARFELNVVVPVVAHERDGVRKGLQYGIGMSFL